MSTTTKINYAKETKALLKDSINRLGGELTNLSTFRSYASVLNAIYNALPKVSGTGSNISLSPTLKGGLDITPIGNCEQDSYSGKNLLGLVNGTYYGTNVIANVNNGTITLNGTTNSTEFIYIHKVVKEINENFTISCNNPIANSNIIVRLSNDYPQYDTTLTDVNQTSAKTYDSSVPLSLNRFILRIANGTTLTNFILKPQLELGSTATTYEPYVGGTASPNPSFPQDIRVVTGDNEVVVQNKNLLNFNILEGGSIKTDDGTNSSSGNYVRTSTYIEVKPNTNYSFQYLTEREDKQIVVYKYGKNQNYLGYSVINSTNGTTLIGDNVYKIRLRFATTAKDVTTISNVQVEYGSTATTYVAHAEQKVTLHNVPDLAGFENTSYVDTIVGKKDDWKIKRDCNKVNLKDLSWIIGAAQPTDTSLIMFASTSLTDRIDGTNLAPLCNYLSYNGYASGANSGKDKGIGFWFLYNTTSHSKNIYIILPKTIARDITELINWATTNNVELVYQLETPTEETITDTTLINDLNNMYDLMGYDGTTNITITSNSANAQMTAQVSALKGLDNETE